MIAPNIEPDHMDSDHAKEMALAGDKAYGACYECDTFYGETMMTNDYVCYWCAYGDEWDTEG